MFVVLEGFFADSALAKPEHIRAIFLRLTLGFFVSHAH